MDITNLKIPAKKSKKQYRKTAEKITSEIKAMPAETIEKIYKDTKNLFNEADMDYEEIDDVELTKTLINKKYNMKKLNFKNEDEYYEYIITDIEETIKNYKKNS